MTSNGDGDHDEGSGSNEATAGAAEAGPKRRRRRRHRKEPADAPRNEGQQPEQPSRSPQGPQRSARRFNRPDSAGSRPPAEISKGRSVPEQGVRSPIDRPGAGAGHRQGPPRGGPQAAPRANAVPGQTTRRYSERSEPDRIPDGETRRTIHRTTDIELADETGPSESGSAWGSDDNLPLKSVEIVAEFPPDPPGTDPDPASFELAGGPNGFLEEDITSVIGVRFVSAGRITWCNAGDEYYAPGERVLVESDRGPRLAWVVAPPARKPVVERGMRRVIRRATERDLGGERTNDDHQTRALRVAKDAGAALRLPLKVFRVEVSGGKLIVYYTTEERLDVRDFARNVSQAMNMRIELRQIGGRDEAKLVGGIGSCGLPLCCTTWLPEFVPVSIKMAKDQGLVLSPSRVSGQCGRLKCCLVYEQEAYAELRKGLPKLGKRVVSARGEGRIVEVDVLTQRVRVSYAPGDTELLPASEVTPKFPASAPTGRADHMGGREPAPRGDSDDTAHDNDRPSDGISDEDPTDPT